MLPIIVVTASNAFVYHTEQTQIKQTQKYFNYLDYKVILL